MVGRRFKKSSKAWSTSETSFGDCIGSGDEGSWIERTSGVGLFGPEVIGEDGRDCRADIMRRYRASQLVGIARYGLSVLGAVNLS